MTQHDFIKPEVIDSLPVALKDFSPTFVRVLAALHHHDFFITRADEARPTVDKTRELWQELSHPSVWIQSKEAPALTRMLQKATPGSSEHTRLTNQIILANLSEQRRLFESLQSFYQNHQAPSFATQLIIETIDLGDSYLRSQGASVRLVMDTAVQRSWYEECVAEFTAFANFLVTQ